MVCALTSIHGELWHVFIIITTFKKLFNCIEIFSSKVPLFLLCMAVLQQYLDRYKFFLY